MSIGKNIAAERKKHGFSQEDIAILVGVSRQAVSKWERDISSPSTDNIIRLAEIFRVSVEKLTDVIPVEDTWEMKERLIYRVPDNRYLWLLLLDKLWVRLLNPLLLILYLEAWQTMYQLAYLGMLRKNLPLLILYSVGISVFLIEGFIAVRTSLKRREVFSGEFMEISDEGIIVFDMSYRRKSDIHWGEVRRVKENNKYYFLGMEGRRFLPIIKSDLSKEQEKIIKTHLPKVFGIKWHVVVAIVWMFVTFAGVFSVVRCAVNLNGALAWKIQELKTEKTVRLTEVDFYKCGLKGILEDAEKKIDFMPHLMVRNADIVFESDGELDSINAYIYGYDMDYKLRAGYLLHYDGNIRRKMTIYTQDWTGVDKSEQEEYDLDNDISVLFNMEENLDIKEVTENWNEDKFGFMYKGVTSWVGPGSYENVFYIDQFGKIKPPPLESSQEVKGASISIYCVDKTDTITPYRFVYKESDGYE